MGVLDDWEKVATDAELSELKKSVSDGKTAVAGAITDKGIITSAADTFATMADNIGQISTLATETADATATAAQILSGKRAYVKGSPVVGTMPNNGGPSAAISSGSLRAGYTTGGSITNLLASNIKKGVVIGGIVGQLSENTVKLSQIAAEEYRMKYQINDTGNNYIYSYQGSTLTIYTSIPIKAVYASGTYCSFFWAVNAFSGDKYTFSLNSTNTASFQRACFDCTVSASGLSFTVRGTRENGFFVSDQSPATIYVFG